MEVWDETASPAMLVKRDVRISTITQSGKMERLTSGEQVTETEYAAISEIGLLPIRETRGTGSEARSTYTSYIRTGRVGITTDLHILRNAQEATGTAVLGGSL